MGLADWGRYGRIEWRNDPVALQGWWLWSVSSWLESPDAIPRRWIFNGAERGGAARRLGAGRPQPAPSIRAGNHGMLGWIRLAGKRLEDSHAPGDVESRFEKDLLGGMLICAADRRAAVPRRRTPERQR